MAPSNEPTSRSSHCSSPVRPSRPASSPCSDDAITMPSTTAAALQPSTSHWTVPSGASASMLGVMVSPPASWSVSQLTTTAPVAGSARGRPGLPFDLSCSQRVAPEAGSSATTTPASSPDAVGGPVVVNTTRSPAATGPPRLSPGWRHASAPVSNARDTTNGIGHSAEPTDATTWPAATAASLGGPMRSTRHRSVPVAGSTATSPFAPVLATTSVSSPTRIAGRSGAGTASRHCSAPVAAASPTRESPARETTVAPATTKPVGAPPQSSGVLHCGVPSVREAEVTEPGSQVRESTRPPPTPPATKEGANARRHRSSPEATSTAMAVGPSSGFGR